MFQQSHLCSHFVQGNIHFSLPSRLFTSLSLGRRGLPSWINLLKSVPVISLGLILYQFYLSDCHATVIRALPPYDGTFESDRVIWLSKLVIYLHTYIFANHCSKFHLDRYQSFHYYEWTSVVSTNVHCKPRLRASDTTLHNRTVTLTSPALFLNQ